MSISVAGRQVPFTPRQFPIRLSRRVGLRHMASVGGKKIGEVGSFLYGGGGSPILGYANLWNLPLHISEIGDLSSVVPVAENVDYIGSNGKYWLVGFLGVLYKFDGESWTKILEVPDEYSEGWTISFSCAAIKWNGSYWLIIYNNEGWGRNKLYKYDGVSVTLVESLENATWGDLAWSPTVEWWIIVGDSYLQTVGKAWKWDGSTLTDISDKISWEGLDVSIKAAEWFEDYWLLGGGHDAHYKQLRKYNPTTDTTEVIIPPRVSGDAAASISCIKVGNGIALIGERHEAGRHQTLYKWDGENITKLTLFEFHLGGISAIDYSEGLFFIVGTDTVVNYEVYHDPKIRTYNVAEDLIEIISPPWDTGVLNATAYTSKVF